MDTKQSASGRWRTRIASRLVSGLLVLVPLGITLFILSLFFNATVGALIPLLGLFLDELPKWVIALLSCVFLILALYTVGALASHVLGRKLIALGERLVAQIPVVKTIYAASKQIIELFQARPEAKGQRVVLADFPAQGIKSLGFLTGSVTLPDGTVACKVFVPTTPNPTTGFLVMIPESSCVPLDMSTEESFKIIMSAGLLAPSAFAGVPRPGAVEGEKS